MKTIIRMIKPQYARNFDFFRVSRSMAAIGVDPKTLRKWSKKEGGPTLWKLKGEKSVWVRFSEVEAFIFNNSEALKDSNTTSE
jgi:hypothetical protein